MSETRYCVPDYSLLYTYVCRLMTLRARKRHKKGQELYGWLYENSDFYPEIYLLCVKILLNWCFVAGIVLCLLGKQEMVQIILREVLSVTRLVGMFLIIGMF